MTLLGWVKPDQVPVDPGVTYMFGWKLPNAFPMGFMLSAKISQQVRTTLLVRLWKAPNRASLDEHNTGKLGIYHPKFQDSELGYTYQREPDEKSALMAASQAGKIGQRLLLGMDNVPQSPTLATTPDTSAEANMSFQAMAEEKPA